MPNAIDDSYSSADTADRDTTQLVTESTQVAGITEERGPITRARQRQLNYS